MMVAALEFLSQVPPWLVIAGGFGGAVLCVGLGRAGTLGLVGAALCIAVALAGAAAVWRANGDSGGIAVVTANTVGAPRGDDKVEWRFDDPHSILLYSRGPGGAPSIGGIRIFAKNLSDRPLTNLRAVIRSYLRNQEMKMNLVVDGKTVDASRAQTVPPRSEFWLVYTIPSLGGGHAAGVPADQFVRDFGDLYFSFGYDTNQIFARLVSTREIEQQVLRIERELGNALPPPATPQP